MTSDLDTMVEILLVEDNPLDVRLALEALRDDKVANQVHVVRDGEEALEYLQRRGRHSGALRPDLILLDLNLPKVDGREVLARIKADPSLRRIPVVVMTASQVDSDLMRSFELDVACYVTKPIDFAQLSTIVRSVDRLWFSIVTLPALGI